MEDNTKRFNEIYDYLLYKHVVSSHNDFADALKTSRPNVTAMLNGRQKVSVDTLRKVCNAFPNTFSMQYLLSGDGQLLIGHVDHHDDAPVVSDNRDQVIEAQKETIASQKETIASLMREIDLLRHRLKLEEVRLMTLENDREIASLKSSV